jgi:flagellum-specific peptidoglycan hydrolase FlgJ
MKKLKTGDTVELYVPQRKAKRNIYIATLLGFITGIMLLVFASSTTENKKWRPSKNAPTRRVEYAKKYHKVAEEEAAKYGIPASITLAQGILESNAGTSQLALENNNHFGIKCFSTSCKKGHCSNFTDDSHKDFFKRYDSAWKSFRDHSEFLQKEHYKFLYATQNVKNWANGLQGAGYATSDTYAEQLLKIIAECDLEYFDR